MTTKGKSHWNAGRPGTPGAQSGGRQELQPNVAVSKEANKVNHMRTEMKLKATLERYAAVSRWDGSRWRNSMCEGVEV